MPDRTDLFTSTRNVIPRNFDADLKRILGSYDNASADVDVALPSNSSLPPGDVTSGLPSNTGRGTLVKIPQFVSTEGGRRYGIETQADERAEGNDVVDSALLSDLMAAIKELGFVIRITDARRTGQQANSVGAGRRSRHVKGQALDIDLINGRKAALDHPDYPDNPDAIRLVQWFIQHGYTPEVAGGSVRGFIFGNGSFGWNRRSARTGRLIPHHHHIHISIA